MMYCKASLIVLLVITLGCSENNSTGAGADAGVDADTDTDVDGDTDTDTDTDVDGDTDTDTDTDTDGDICPAGGVEVHETCWYALESCGYGCAELGLEYDFETDWYLGPSSTNREGCALVMDALGLGEIGTMPIDDKDAYGCHFHEDVQERRWSSSSMDIFMSAPDVLRVCACR
ncbi:MAG: hypothetical protein JW704_03480 [Anaerolineaceae bacterium]|nr:hypothetical protein [Anaerolineaceae bacterium]